MKPTFLKVFCRDFIISTENIIVWLEARHNYSQNFCWNLEYSNTNDSMEFPASVALSKLCVQIYQPSPQVRLGNFVKDEV